MQYKQGLQHDLEMSIDLHTLMPIVLTHILISYSCRRIKSRLEWESDLCVCVD